MQHSSDLGGTDAWAPAAPGSLVPDTTSTVGGVDYVVSGSGTLNVTATIPVANASGGKLFGRLLATE